MFLLIFLTHSVMSSSIPPPPSCNHVKYAYSLRGVPESEIPGYPISGIIAILSCQQVSGELRVCVESEVVEQMSVINQALSQIHHVIFQLDFN